jgi:hypothetical protein
MVIPPRSCPRGRGYSIPSGIIPGGIAISGGWGTLYNELLM